VPQLSPTTPMAAVPVVTSNAHSRAAARRRGFVIGGLFVATIITAIVISAVSGHSGPSEKQLPYDHSESRPVR